MCGIAGIVDLNGKYKSELPGIVKKMSDSIVHRGPDDEGVFVHNNLALAHRRLSILDLSAAGHQPMRNDREDLSITFNGEIYNYIEIRKELIALGRKFKSNTDTEVVLQAYDEWGENCLAKFNGMWAFVIYDKKKNLLFASRDRFGVKPLYYYHDKNVFLFASEHKAILASSIIETEINKKAAFDYLVLGQLEVQEESLFENIFELQPSHAFIFDINNNNLKKWKYYSLQYQAEWENYNEAKAEQLSFKVNELLSNAVKIRLRSDVEIGACLSGGLDSSAIVGLINQLRNKTNSQLKVFTATYKDAAIDETYWATKMAQYVNAEAYQISPSANDLADDLEKLVYAQDIPFLSTSTFSQYSVMKLVKNTGIKVTLDGQGADEIFGGYDPHIISFWLELARRGKFQLLMNEWNVGKNNIVNSDILKYNLMKFIVLKYFPISFINKMYQKNTEAYFINPDFWKENSQSLNYVPFNIYSSLNEQLFNHATAGQLKLMLRTNERNAMFHSVEARQPFADDLPLIEFMFQQASVYKIHNKQTKYLLRQSLKGIVPEEIRLRKDKLGFSAPESQWLFQLKNVLREYLTDDLSLFFDVKKLKENWDQYFNHPNPQLWRIINFAVWKKVFGKQA